MTLATPPVELDLTDPAADVVDAAEWEVVLRREEERADRYGQHPAVILFDFDDNGGSSGVNAAKALAVVKGAIRGSDVAARTMPSRVAVIACGGGERAAYLAERLRLLLSLAGIPSKGVRARSRDQYGNLSAAWRAAVTDEAGDTAPSFGRQNRGHPRLRNAAFLDGLISELHLDLAVVAGVARRLEKHDRPELIQLGALLRRHADRVESFVSALELISGKLDHRAELVDPGAILQAECVDRHVELDVALRWPAPIHANPIRLRIAFGALLEAVAPAGQPMPPVTVSGSGLTLIFWSSADLLDNARRNWRLRLARRFIEHEGGHFRVRHVRTGLRVEVDFAKR